MVAKLHMLMQVSTLYNILCAVHSLHIHRVVHCDLQPVQFGWFNEQQHWKLLGLATWSHTGSARSSTMCYSLRYAAPEVRLLCPPCPTYRTKPAAPKLLR